MFVDHVASASWQKYKKTVNEMTTSVTNRRLDQRRSDDMFSVLTTYYVKKRDIYRTFMRSNT